MRRANQKRLEAIWRTVEERPGLKAGRVARELNLPRSSVMRTLPAMEAEGLLLSEDDRGGLWREQCGHGFMAASGMLRPVDQDIGAYEIVFQVAMAMALSGSAGAQ